MKKQILFHFKKKSVIFEIYTDIGNPFLVDKICIGVCVIRMTDFGKVKYQIR